jgi:hypothetical protein
MLLWFTITISSKRRNIKHILIPRILIPRVHFLVTPLLLNLPLPLKHNPFPHPHLRLQQQQQLPLNRNLLILSPTIPARRPTMRTRLLRVSSRPSTLVACCNYRLKKPRKVLQHEMHTKTFLNRPPILPLVVLVPPNNLRLS